MTAPSTPLLQTREQRFAAAVYEKVMGIAKEKPGEENKSYRNEYGGMAHKLPILIRTAGLAQAIAFVQARGKEAHKKLLTDLADVLTKPNADKLLEVSRTSSLRDYMRLTRDALDALLWFKRFAQSVLDVDASDEGSNPDD